MYPAGGSDIFVYPREMLGTVPPFAIGRGYWDLWLMWRARKSGAKLIDATAALTAVHQDHDYAHVAGTPPGTTDDKKVYITAEGERNLVLAGGYSRLYTAYDATDILTGDGALLSTLRADLIFRRVKASLIRSLRTMSPRGYDRYCRLREQFR
jgi:hypothetical protein